MRRRAAPADGVALPAGLDDGGFARRLVAWQRTHGRHDLPWQGSGDAYRVWLSEIMLQQTQVAAVLGYYARFLERFPTLAALAAASLDDVMPLWAGLGYYSRARNLHACARAVVQRHGGRLPDDPALLRELPGIGRSTAAAIAAFAYGRRAAILDGNVKRVLCRVFAIDGDPASGPVERDLWALAERLLPGGAGAATNPADIGPYTQGLMDLGATVCTRARPRCDACPMASDCAALRQGRVAELPRPRARAPRPVRELALLVLRRDDGGVHVVRRPDRGLWGGLWTLPELPVDADPAAATRALGLAVRDARRLPEFEHGFTHFVLRARPWLVDVADATPAAATVPAAPPARAASATGDAIAGEAASAVASADRWLSPSGIAGAALPKPIRDLLAGLAGLPDAPGGDVPRQASPA